MSLHHKRRETQARMAAVRLSSASFAGTACQCLPPSTLCRPTTGQETDTPDICVQFVCTSQGFSERLCTLLQEKAATMPVFSVILLHIAQLKASPTPQEEHAPPFKRSYGHAPASLHEQIFSSARRVMRLSDRLCLEDEAGGAFIFPEVDRAGSEAILERVYQSISLLQAETVIPPLVRETTVMLGCASLQAPSLSLERFLFSLSQPARRFTLRPALPRQGVDVPEALPSGIMHIDAYNGKPPVEKAATKVPGTIPFLDLPRELPRRLKQVLSYQVALEVRCAPVGREQNRLTVAMADPHDAAAIQRLQEATGMSIFPVACEIEDLTLLLTKGW